MNHKCVFFLLILLFCSLCLGKPVLTFGDKARTYLNNRNQKLLKEFNQKKVVDSEKGYSYVVAIDEFTHKTIDEMKSFFLKTYNVHEIGNRILKIKKDNVKLDLSELKSHRASCALRMLKKVMPANYSNQFMLRSVDTERSFSKSQGVKCLSYASKIKISNSENIGYIIDAPHSRHSWRKYNHENKGSARFSRYDR